MILHKSLRLTDNPRLYSASLKRHLVLVAQCMTSIATVLVGNCQLEQGLFASGMLPTRTIRESVMHGECSSSQTANDVTNIMSRELERVLNFLPIFSWYVQSIQWP